MLYRNSVHVLAIDRKRSLAQAGMDLLLIICFFLWTYEIIAYAYPLPFHFFPAWTGILLIHHLRAKIAGGIILAIGSSIYALALIALGDSWRLGIDRQAATSLITSGIFAWTRNPIYLALDLMALGTYLILGRLVFLVLGLLIAGLLQEQIRREEGYLSQAYGQAYHQYCSKVGRYFKW